MTSRNEGERRNQAERRAEAERKMLAAAMDLVARKGIGAISLTEVGQAAGYSRSLAAHYFASRDELLTALTGQVMRSFVSRMEARALDKSPLATLTRMMELYFADVASDSTGWRVFLELLHEALVNPAIAQGLAPLHVGALDRIEQLISAGIASGDLRPDIDPRAEAAVILAALRGLAGLLITYPDNVEFRNASSALASSLVHGLRRRTARNKATSKPPGSKT